MLLRRILTYLLYAMVNLCGRGVTRSAEIADSGATAVYFETMIVVQRSTLKQVYIWDRNVLKVLRS
jgi:hypothetical protein